MYLQLLPHLDTHESREKIDLVTRIIYGGQTDKFDSHYYGYSLTTITLWLEAAGFTGVRRFERSSLAFAPFTDAAYARVGDVPISLNVEAIKPMP